MNPAQDDVKRVNKYLEIVAEEPTKKDYEIAQELGISHAKLSTLRTSFDLSSLVAKCRKYGIDPRAVKNYWVKDQHISLNVQNSSLVTYEDIRDDMIARMKSYAPKYPAIKRIRAKQPHLLVIDPADIHIGKLAVLEESNDTYNSQIAVKRVLDGVGGLIDKASGFEIEKVLLVVGNDVLNTDNRNGSTTSGTPQDVDGAFWTAYKLAQDMYIKVIEMLLQVADVHVIHNPGNHDRVSGSILSDSLAVWFRNNKQVSFDVDMTARKYYQYGENMIVTSHGDGLKMQQLPTLVASERSQMWGKTRFRYVYLHHVHHKKKINWISGQDYHGVTVQYLRSPSGTDFWHNNKGYTAQPKAVEAFIHHKEKGQVASLTHYF